jgi:hypothetical protein
VGDGGPAGVRIGGEYNGDSQVEIEAIIHQIAWVAARR